MKSQSNQRRNEQSYDIVIIGAGPSAIGLIYGLLLPYAQNKQSPPFQIAVIERGSCTETETEPETETPSNPQVQDPKSWFYAAHPSSHALEKMYKRDREPFSSVVYPTVPQKGLGNRILSVPTGQGWGGGTNIHACLFVRPARDDFKDWPACETWRRPRIMQSVLEIENVMKRNGALVQETFHHDLCGESDDEDNDDGNMNGLERSDFHFEKVNWANKCEEDMRRWGRKVSTVASTMKKIGSHAAPGSGMRYQRVNFYQGILKPLLDENPKLCDALHMMGSVQAERLVFCRLGDSKHVSVKGVECSRVGTSSGHGDVFTIQAKIVIMCAGAILTPALLLASGIGDESELRKQGVEPILCGEDNPWSGVGKRLCDHVVMACGFWTRRRFPLPPEGPNSVRGWFAVDVSDYRNVAKCNARLLLKVMDGSSSSTILPGVIASTCHRRYSFKPFFACMIVNGFLVILSKVLSFVVGILMRMSFLHSYIKWHTMQVLVCLMNPCSKGTVTIMRKNKGSKNCTRCHENTISDFDITIDPAYLSEEDDFIKLSFGQYFVKRIQSSWIPNAIEVLPGLFYKLIGGSNHMRQYITDFALPYYHWSGTCSIKSSQISDDSYVVNEDLKVRMVSNLYICDASVLPSALSVPPTLTLAAIGFSEADVIRRYVISKME